jgi:hypothetical protein
MRDLLAKKASRANSFQVVSLVANNPKHYKELIEIIQENRIPISEKAAWSMNHCFEDRVGFFEDYYPELTQIVADASYSDSIKRNIVRIFQFKQIPKKFHASVINSCFDLVLKKETAVALKAFSLQVLENMTIIYPELINELKASINDLLPTATPGLKNRGQHILNRLRS